MAIGAVASVGTPSRGKRIASNDRRRKSGSIASSDDTSPTNTPQSASEAQFSGPRPTAISASSRCFAPDPGAEHDVFCDHHHEAITGTDLERGLHLHVAARRLLAE